MENLRIIVDSFLTLISNISIRNTIDSTFKINSEFDLCHIYGLSLLQTSALYRVVGSKLIVELNWMIASLLKKLYWGVWDLSLSSWIIMINFQFFKTLPLLKINVNEMYSDKHSI